LYQHTGEDLSQLGNNFVPKSKKSSNNQTDKRKSNLLLELIHTEKEYIKILKIALNSYLPAAQKSSTLK